MDNNTKNSLLVLRLQTVTSSWPMLRCQRDFPSSTARMASASSQASPGLRSCRRAVPVSSCTDPRPVKASFSALMKPWRSAKSLKMRSCSTQRQVKHKTLLYFCLFLSRQTSLPDWCFNHSERFYEKMCRQSHFHAQFHFLYCNKLVLCDYFWGKLHLNWHMGHCIEEIITRGKDIKLILLICAH